MSESEDLGLSFFIESKIKATTPFCFRVDAAISSLASAKAAQKIGDDNKESIKRLEDLPTLASKLLTF